ncbi:hypothetical protein DGMP_06410 [Desulfomarina profundi]|uniref:Uncharacterized protein n=1 Tax=Desulfomarina profundi TaxID=2772557 RepID=A0A8D5FJD9_9BACT|nr:hypothetical protein DGMP_06410 [Desulfomarina profundi]
MWRHGKNGAGNRQWLCRTCGRVFVLKPFGITDEVKTITDRLIGEGIPVPVITRVMGGYVSRRWIYNRKRLING